MQSLAHRLQRPALQPYAQLALAVAAIGYPVARIVLPGTAQWATLTPLLLLLLWAAWRVVRPAGRVQSPLGPALLLAAGALALSSLAGVAEQPAIVAGLFDWVEMAVVLFLVIAVLAAGWPAQVVARATLLVVSGVLLYNAWLLLAWWYQWALLWQPGMPWLPVALRISLPESQPNQVAMLINVGVPLAIAALWRARHAWQCWLWGIWLLLLLPVQVYSSSRGSWLGLAALSATMLLPLLWSAWQARRWRRLWATLLLGGGYAALFALLLLGNLQAVQAQRAAGPLPVATPSPASSTPVPGTPAPTAAPRSQPAASQATRSLTNPSGRSVFWQRALEFFAERPLLGVGPNGYAARYRAVEPHSVKFVAPHAHNIPLHILSQSGSLGVIALLFLAGHALLIWWRGWQVAAPLLPAPGNAARMNDPAADRLLLLSSGASLVGLGAHGMVEVPLVLTTGLVLYLLAAALTAGGAWRLQPPHNRLRFTLRAVPIAVQPVHALLVLAAVVAWGSSGVVLLQRNAAEALAAQARAALRQGEAARALALYEQNISRYPWDRSAYSGRAVAIAWQALHNPQRLPAALQAQTSAARHDPANQAVPLNRAALLAQMGRLNEAEAAIRAFLATNRTEWAVPDVLLARVLEQTSAPDQAREAWQTALKREPMLAESAACLRSALCAALPLQDEYAALVQARQLAAAPDAAALQQIERLARSWRSVDIWAVGVLAAQRAGDSQAAQRLLQGAVDEAANVAREPTMQLAIVLLRDALARNDRATVRQLVDTWMFAPHARLVPQVTSPLVTTTEYELAETLLQAAVYLQSPERLAAAERYLAHVQAALPR
jgi:O-antigen ligase